MNKNFKLYFKKKKILITGGTGLIGRPLTNYLKNLGAKVTVVSLDKIKPMPGIKFIYGNLNDYKFCKKITKKKDFVFHLAGIKGSALVTKTKPSSFYVPLLMMNTNILEACRLNKVKKTLYCSSIGAYQKSSIFREKNFKFNSYPMDFFPGWAKRAAEIQILSYKKQYKLNNFYIVRPSNVYGPGDNFDEKNAMVIPSLIKKIVKANRGNTIEIWGDGNEIRDFIFSEDVAYGLIQTLYYGTKNYDFINIGSGMGVSIKKLVDTLSKLKKFDYKFNRKKQKGFKKRVMDISLSKRIIKFKPKVSLKDGLIQTIDWYKKNQKEFKKRKNYFN